MHSGQDADFARRDGSGLSTDYAEQEFRERIERIRGKRSGVLFGVIFVLEMGREERSGG